VRTVASAEEAFDVEDARRVLRAGYQRHLGKPIDPHDLVAASRASAAASSSARNVYAFAYQAFTRASSRTASWTRVSLGNPAKIVLGT